MSPFEVFFGRISNAVLRGHLGHTSEISDEMVSSSSTISGPQDPEPVSQGDGESDVPFSSSDETDQDTVRSHCVAEWLETCRLLREASLKSTNKAASRMIARRLGMRIPTEYRVGDEVLVRLPNIRPGRRRKQKYHRLITSLQGKVVEVNPQQYRYRVEYQSHGGQSSRWFSVTDVTSPSVSLENDRNLRRQFGKYLFKE